MSALPALQTRGFLIASADSGGELVVKLSGNGDSAAVQPLDDYLVELHAQLLARRARAVALDLAQLYFMNSSCIKAFASWIHDVQHCGEPYTIRMRLNPGLAWQKRTLRTLARLAPSIVILEEVAG